MTPPNLQKEQPRLAVFISPHGFGHASRACAVMEGLLRLDAGIQFDIFGQTPGWFFDKLPTRSYRLHPAVTDVGFVQHTPLVEDLPQTLDRLESFTAGLQTQADVVARKLKQDGSCLALCDISPLGILAARQAGIPSVIVENFTWDWLYRHYTGSFPRFLKMAEFFDQIYRQADLHIQTEPLCRHIEGLPICSPASRLPVYPPEWVRSRLGISSSARIALVSLGDLLKQYPGLNRAAMRMSGWIFLIPDAAAKLERQDNLVLLPRHFEIGHPDLANASTVLVAKSGYSTIAEAYACGIPFGYLNRPQFPESDYLESFLQREMPALEITNEEMLSGDWTGCLAELELLPRRPHLDSNGADEISRLIYNRMVNG